MSDAEIGSYFHLSPEVIDLINNTCLICGHDAGDHTPDYCMVCDCEVPDSTQDDLSQNSTSQGTQVTARPQDNDVGVLTRFVSLNVSESSDTITTNVAIQADGQPTNTDPAANDHERSDTMEQPSVTKLDAGSSFATATPPESGVERSDTVTITISREDAESWLSKQDDACTWDKCTAPACVLERAFRAALEGER